MTLAIIGSAVSLFGVALSTVNALAWAHLGRKRIVLAWAAMACVQGAIGLLNLSLVLR